MKVALQLHLIPGEHTSEKLKWAGDHGVDGIEVSAFSKEADYHEKLLRDFKHTPVPVVSMCGNPSFDFLDPDPEKRGISVAQSKQCLETCGRLGAVGQIVPPIFGKPRLNDLSPLKDAVTLEKELLVELCKDLGEHAARHKTLFLLEPLNRYEQHLLRRQADGVEIIKRCGHPSVRLISDLFHMHIEETDSPRAIREAGKYIKHVHLADNTRLEPGTGDLNFVACFRALYKAGFKGYMAFECGISGNTPKEKEKALVKSLDFVRACIRKAKG